MPSPPPAPDHADYWIHERLQVIEKALATLLLVAEAQPGATDETVALLVDVEKELRKNGEFFPLR